MPVPEIYRLFIKLSKKVTTVGVFSCTHWFSSSFRLTRFGIIVNSVTDCRWGKTPLDEAKTFDRQNVVEYLESMIGRPRRDEGGEMILTNKDNTF